MAIIAANRHLTWRERGRDVARALLYSPFLVPPTAPGHGEKEDPDHSAPDEREAAKALSEYAFKTALDSSDKVTGFVQSLGGAAIARAFEENGKAVLEGWISPHFRDPVIVRVRSDSSIWAFADSRDAIPPKTSKEWRAMDDQSGGSNVDALAVEKILRDKMKTRLSAPLKQAQQG